MHRIVCSAAVLLFAALAPAHASAQNFQTAVGYGAGGIWISPLNQNGATASDQLRLDPGWVAVGQVEQWTERGRFGLRFDGAYTQRPLELRSGVRDINAWFADAAILLRILSPSPDRAFAPFLSVGGGVVRYSLGRGPRLTFPEAGAAYNGDNQTQWAAVFGLGADIDTGLAIQETALGIRLEVADHLALESPFEPLAGGSFGPVHNIRFGISVVSLLGELMPPARRR